MAEASVSAVEVAPRRAEASLGAQSIVMSIGLLLAGGFGFVSEVVIAYRFGASASTDAYLVASQIPVVADNLLAGPALQNALIPIAAAETADGSAQARLRRLVWNMSTLVLVVTGVVGLLVAVSATWIVPLFAAGFSPEARRMTAELTMLAMVGLPFMALARIAWAVLNSKGRYWGPALSLSIGNIVLILAAWALAPSLGVFALGIGFVLGLALQVGVQYSELGRLGLIVGGRVDWRDPDVLRALQLFLPLAIGQLTVVLSPAIDNAIATFLPPGGVTVIRYAMAVTAPFAIISTAVSVPSLPRLSRGVSLGNLAGVTAMLQRVVGLLCLVLFGVAAWLFISRYQVIQILYQRGAFDALAVRRTADTLAVFAFYVPFAGIYYYLLRGLVAFSAVRIILVLNALALVLNVALDLLLLPTLATAGIALSSVCVQMVYMIVAVLVLNRELHGQRFLPGVWQPLAANGFAAVVAALGALAANVLMERMGITGFWTPWIIQQILVVAIYLGVSRVFRACDLDWATNLLGTGLRALSSLTGK